MKTILLILWLAGAGTFLVGVGGFVDGRKRDGRFKTGYKNNAPDTRNFGQAGKRVLWGVGLSIVAMAVTALSSSNEHQQRDDAADASVASVPASSTAATSVAASAESAPVGLVAIPASDESNASGASVSVSSNEQIVQAARVSAPSMPVGASAAQSVLAVVDGGSKTACNDDGTFLGNNICKSPVLAAIYQRELEEYEAAQSRIGGADVGVRAEQERWLAQVAQDCSDMQCLTAAFDKRIADLSSRYHGG